MRRSSLLLALAAATALATGAHAQDKPPAAPPAAPTTGEATVPVVTVPKPDGTDLVVTDDGKVWTGEVSGTDTEIVVRTGDGGERRFPRDDVSIALSGGKRIHRGEESGIREAWLAWLKATHDDLQPTRKIADADPAAKAAWWADVLAAADRCAGWKMPYAATALLAEGMDVGTWDDEAERRAIEWEPVEFPFSPEDSEKAKLLATWAREIVPVGGRWVLRKEGVGESSRSQLWTENAIALRSRNLLVFSLDKDPAAVGSLLRQGEKTIRALESVFGKPDVTSGDPLEIRLFRDRKQYLTESDTASGFAMAWSAGFFSPGDFVSRFYVSRDPTGKKFDEIELHRVLSHELTHHWIEARFCAGSEFETMGDKPNTSAIKQDGGRRGDQPGHWIVEGIARFVEAQALLFRKNGFKMDDARAGSIRDAARAYKFNVTIPIVRYVEISPKGFQFLGDHGLKGYGDSERGVFYDQGGALCFFMMNRRGPEGRKLLVQYLRDVYGGRMTKESWTRLGFASALDLQKEFDAFLASVK